MIVIVIAFGFAALFVMGYALGDQAGWDRCWKELTKNDRWRKDEDGSR